MKQIRKVIEIDEELCNGCGECVPSCEEGAIQIIDGKAKLVADKYCDGLGACLGECPTGALRIVEREAEVFDEEAVEEHLKVTRAPAAPPTPCGCPSAQVKTFAGVAAPNAPADDQPAASALSHWPVQIRLVPPTAPFLNGADLLVAADCVPVAYPRFHQDFLKDKTVMVGCPKFDDMALYTQRFADIFAANDVKSITAVVMVVPCCQGLPVIIAQGMRQAGKQIPMEIVTISIEGEILNRQSVEV
ncbi:MAG: 4Fe-4S ferredoxin [Nitrospiraceae bacterium]|nr:4Fe-4S ferredoxin [Nitrospiraceae bacterium]